MRRYISFSSTREVAEAGAQPQQLPLRRTQEVARQSLVNVGGLTYPLLQRASIRRTALGRHQSRLSLTRASIEGVVRAALRQVPA
jgi:hypothetical protein